MYYWNRDNFEGLLSLAEALGAHAHFVHLAEYCANRERGLRRQAFDALERFLEEAEGWPADQARERVLAILELHRRAPEAHQFLTEPLHRRLLTPVLRSWEADGSATAEALRWLGILSRDLSFVERALEQAPDDVIARRYLVNACLSFADYAMHHLYESRFIGSTEDTRHALDRARTFLSSAPDAGPFADLANEHAGLEQMLDDWVEYKRSTSGSFADWCRARGRKYSWATAIYYGTPDKQDEGQRDET
ncbi:MAG: hypothetical protein AAF533_03770 [Acidobacteriota bacterium]